MHVLPCSLIKTTMTIGKRHGNTPVADPLSLRGRPNQLGRRRCRES